MLAEVLACLEVALLLVNDILFASSLIPKKVDSFLEIGSFSRRQRQQRLSSLFPARESRHYEEH